MVNHRNYMSMNKEHRENLYKFINKHSLEDMSQFGSLLTPDFAAHLETTFLERVIKERRLLDRENFSRRCLLILKSRYPSLYNTVAKKWIQVVDSVGRWQFLLDMETGQFDGGGTPIIKPSLLIILTCYYPKVDKGPLYENRHLFKLPFSIHMDTDKISLPVTRDELLNYELPSDLVSLEDIISYYNNHIEEEVDTDKKVHPNFMKGLLLLKSWLSNV